MHKYDVAHRDLKPENVLLKRSEDGDQLKICDLGAAKLLDKHNPCAKNTPYVVSRYYRAPELILGTNYYDCSIDIWAAGCILFELITRTPLFPGETEGL
jgi:glycogen synthase kinase 3 beta